MTKQNITIFLILRNYIFFAGIYSVGLSCHDIQATQGRVRPRFFDQVGHQTTNASIGNVYFLTKSCHCQTYQNYEQSRQKLGTFSVNKVLKISKFSKISLM